MRALGIVGYSGSGKTTLGERLIAILVARGLRIAAVGGVGFGLAVAFLFVAYKTTTLLSANVIACLQPLVLGLVAHRYAGRLDAVAWAATLFMSAMTTLPPSRAWKMAISLPMPLAAPVMMQTLS